MRKISFLFILLSLISMQTFAWRIVDGILILEKGDNLSRIAHTLYGRDFDYMRLWNNRLDTISSNPNLVYDGMKFKLDPIVKYEIVTDTIKTQPVINNYYTKEDSPFDQIWNLLWFVLGFISSLYGSIIFER